MKRLVRGLALGVVATLAIGGVAAGDGHARVVIPFDMDAGEVAEGVAVDEWGNVFTAVSGQGRFMRLPSGAEEAQPLVDVTGLAESDFGVTGLAFNGDDDQYYYALYGAVVSANPDLNGIVFVDPGAKFETDFKWRHIPGTNRMGMPNGIAFSDEGESMYVSDSVMGAIWRLPLFGFIGYSEPDVWIADPLLEGTGAIGLPFPVGANGVAVRDGVVYVGVTEQGTVVGVPIEPDGAAGEPFVHAELPGVAVDGIVFDAAGNLYVADPPAHTLWKVAPDGAVTAVADVGDGLSGPSSVALWDGPEGLVAYVSNQAIGDPETIKHGPSIIAVSLE